MAGPLLALAVLAYALSNFPVPFWLTKLPLVTLLVVVLADGLIRVCWWERIGSYVRPTPFEVLIWSIKVILFVMATLVVAGVYNQVRFDPFALLAFTVAAAAASRFPEGKEVIGLYSRPDQDKLKVVAAHEAGHAMVFALLAEGLPIDFEAHALPLRGIGGYVKGAVSHWGDGKEGLRWTMLLKVAGIAGERAIGNKYIDGTEWDLIDWDTQARKYNLMYSTKRFPAYSTDLADAAHRAEILYALLEENIEDVIEFIEENRDVFDALRNEFMQCRVVRARRAIHLLSNVRFTEKCRPVNINYPRGFMDWPEEGLRCREEAITQQW